jgi:hypothetical protein
MADVLEVRKLRDTTSALAQLSEVSRLVDQLWQDSMDGTSPDDAIALGEASQGIHRALIALAAYSAPEATSREFAVDWG